MFFAMENFGLNVISSLSENFMRLIKSIWTEIISFQYIIFLKLIVLKKIPKRFAGPANYNNWFGSDGTWNTDPLGTQ